MNREEKMMLSDWNCWKVLYDLSPLPNHYMTFKISNFMFRIKFYLQLCKWGASVACKNQSF